jgi:hypothetical protein
MAISLGVDMAGSPNFCSWHHFLVRGRRQAPLTDVFTAPRQGQVHRSHPNPTHHVSVHQVGHDLLVREAISMSFLAFEIYHQIYALLGIRYSPSSLVIVVLFVLLYLLSSCNNDMIK